MQITPRFAGEPLKKNPQTGEPLETLEERFARLHKNSNGLEKSCPIENKPPIKLNLPAQDSFAKKSPAGSNPLKEHYASLRAPNR